MGNFEKKLMEKQRAKAELEKVKKIAEKEFPTVKHITSAIRYLDIFSKLMATPEFAEWMKEHIVLHDEIKDDSKEIITHILYKKDRVTVNDDQNIVRCPNCQLQFDANVETPRIQLVKEMPEKA